MVNFRNLYLKQLTNGKIKHINFIETVDEVLSVTKKEGDSHLFRSESINS